MSEISKKIPNTPLKFLWLVTKPHKNVALPAIVFVTGAAVMEICMIFVISRLIDDFSVAVDQTTQLAVLLNGGLLFFGVMVSTMLLWRLSGFTGIAWIIKTDGTAYTGLYTYVSKHSHSYFSDRFAGSLSNKISNAASGSARIIDQFLWRVWPEVIGLLTTIYLFWAIDWSVGATISVIAVFVVAINILRVKRRRPHVISYSAASSRLRGEGVDMLTNIATVRQYSRRKDELERIGITVSDRIKKDFKQWYMGEWTMVMNSIFGATLMGSMLLVLYVLLQSGQASAGSLVLVLILLSRVAYMFNIMGMLMNGFVRQYGEIEEGLKEVVVPHEILDNHHATKLEVQNGEILWNKVGFNFDKQPVFENFSLLIPAGQRIGLVGHSGAGKTTFVSLLLRQHNLKSGQILIDGQSISEVTQDSLRESMAVVPQEPLLFHRSIRENILYGNPDATEEKMIEAAKKAEAHDFIMDLPEGYETLVGERGVKLSGGQKQRVAIARAILKDAPILMLDEATSALDSESEVAIQKALEELMENRTVIAVAHRLSTLRKMDRIIVLEGGKIVEDGSHDELSVSGGVYQRLWEHQAGGFLVEGE